jgi:hypothetical protein
VLPYFHHQEETMIRVACFKCRQRFTLAEEFVAVELAKLDDPHPRYFTAHCPSCRQAIKVSLKGVRLPEVPPPAASEPAEEEKAEIKEPEDKETGKAPAEG